MHPPTLLVDSKLLFLTSCHFNVVLSIIIRLFVVDFTANTIRLKETEEDLIIICEMVDNSDCCLRDDFATD